MTRTTRSSDYLHEILVEDHPELKAFRAVEDNELCLDGADESGLAPATEINGPFSFKNVRDFSLRVVKSAADRHSENVQNRYALKQDGDWT